MEWSIRCSIPVGVANLQIGWYVFANCMRKRLVTVGCASVGVWVTIPIHLLGLSIKANPACDMRNFQIHMFI